MGKKWNYKRGVRNRYYNGMPFSERCIKDIIHLITSSIYFFKNGFKSKTVFIYPHYPSSGSTIYKVAKILNMKLTNKYSAKCSLAFYYEYLTFREEFEFLDSIASNIKVVNLYSRDISKRYVENTFQEVFGYGTFISPLTFKGKCVRKNDINAKHDGTIIECPIKESSEEFIYQILIDNDTQDGYVEDIRVPIVNGLIDFLYLNKRFIDKRFGSSNNITKVVSPSDVFSDDEMSKINLFCKKIKLEYGELDILRNKDDGKIYIIDANNTPQGPPANMSKLDSKEVLTKMAHTFKKEFLN